MTKIRFNSGCLCRLLTCAPRRVNRTQFSVRALMAVVALCSFALSFVIVPIWRAHDRARLLSHLGEGSANYGPYSIAGIRCSHLPLFVVSLCGEGTFADVIGVDLSGPIKSDADLSILAQLPKLQFLELWDASLSPRQMEQIAGCRSLWCVSFNFTSLSDASIKKLSDLRVEELDLNGDEVTDDWLLAASEIATLKSLKLWTSNQISARGFNRAARLKSLESLEITSCDNIGDDAIAHLLNMKSLKALTLTDLPISDCSCDAIASLPQLRFLKITKCEITEKGASRLRELSQLERLDLGQ